MLPAIVSHLSPSSCWGGTTTSAAGSALGTTASCSRQLAAGSMRFSLLQIDVEVEEPETSENPTQSFEIYNIVWRRTQLLVVIIYII